MFYQRNLTKEEVNRKNREFLELQEKWKRNRDDKKSWDGMWFIAVNAFYAALKKKAGGKRNDLEELALDGTTRLMNRIKNGTMYKYVNKTTGEVSYSCIEEDYWVRYLPTVVYYIVLKLLYNPKQIAVDREENLDNYIRTISYELNDDF